MGLPRRGGIRDYIAQHYPGVAVRAGLIPELSGFRKFGTNGDIDTPDLPNL